MEGRVIHPGSDEAMWCPVAAGRVQALGAGELGSGVIGGGGGVRAS